jgi:hypothetical protein
MAVPSEEHWMYLSFDQWSPRFDSTFFSFKLPSKALLASPPDNEASNDRIPGNKNHPAWYYTIQVYSERRSHSITRRYSQFRWLYDELRSHPPDAIHEQDAPNQPPISIPPKTCPFQFQTEDFAQNRLEQLHDFLKDALQRPGYASHPAVSQFFELDRFSVKVENPS